MNTIKREEDGLYEQETISKIEMETILEKKLLICKCVAPVISELEFMTFFHEVGGLVERYGIKKLIFDKRSLRVFHQPSMEWYHVHWKKEMAKVGLKTYRKILPEDKVFKMSVEIGRKKIREKNPEFNFEDFDIQYCESIEEAISK